VWSGHGAPGALQWWAMATSRGAGGGTGEGSCGGSGRPHSAPFGAPRCAAAAKAESEEGETPRNRVRSRASSALKRGRGAADADATRVRPRAPPRQLRWQAPPGAVWCMLRGCDWAEPQGHGAGACALGGSRCLSSYCRHASPA